MDKLYIYSMDYHMWCHIPNHLAWSLCIFLVIKLADVAAQTEGDTGYEYNEAYDEYDEESVLGIEPNFDVQIVNVTVVAGQMAVLPCSIEDLGQYKVAWLDQNNMPMTYDDRRIVDDSRFKVVRPYPKEWNLQIQDIRWEDQGQYRCTINTQPPKSKSVVLHVKVPADIINELSTNDVTFQEGDTVVLVCNVTGVPQPEVTWYRRPTSNKLNQKESKMCKPRMADSGIGHVGEVIIIKNVSRYCDDIYECVADNGVPPAVSRQMRVTVEFPPEITMPTTRIGQALGKDTILECTITAFPLINSYWEKDGKEITGTTGSSSAKYSVQPYEEGEHTITLSLRVHKLQISDYGQYRCVASNALGTDSESMWLYQYGKRNDNNDGRGNIPKTSWPHHKSTPWPRDNNPAYDVDSMLNGRKRDNTGKYWDNLTDKLSSSSNSISGCYYAVLLAACCLLTVVNLQRLSIVAL